MISGPLKQSEIYKFLVLSKIGFNGFEVELVKCFQEGPAATHN
jgi:hypothetical protein